MLEFAENGAGGLVIDSLSLPAERVCAQRNAQSLKAFLQAMSAGQALGFAQMTGGVAHGKHHTAGDE